MPESTYQVTIDGEVWTVTQRRDGTLWITSPDGAETRFMGSWRV